MYCSLDVDACVEMTKHPSLLPTAMRRALDRFPCPNGAEIHVLSWVTLSFASVTYRSVLVAIFRSFSPSLFYPFLSFSILDHIILSTWFSFFSFTPYSTVFLRLSTYIYSTLGVTYFSEFIPLTRVLSSSCAVKRIYCWLYPQYSIPSHLFSRYKTTSH